MATDMPGMPLSDCHNNQRQQNQVKQAAPASFGIYAPLQQQQTPVPSSMPASQQPSLMSSSTTTAATATTVASPRYVVEEEMTTVKVPMLRPRPALLKVLHLAGGVGETFTMGEIINHVKDYIRERTLYDEQDPRIVHCGRDLLSVALGVNTFTVHDALSLFKKNSTMEPDSCIRVYRHLVTRPVNCQPQVTTGSGAASYTTAAQSITETTAATSSTTTATSSTTTTTSSTTAITSSTTAATSSTTAATSSTTVTTSSTTTATSSTTTTTSSTTATTSLTTTATSSTTVATSSTTMATSASMSSYHRPTAQQSKPEIDLQQTAQAGDTQPEPSSSCTSAIIKFKAAQSYVTVVDSDLDENSTRKQMTSADSSSDSGRKSGCWDEYCRKEKRDPRRGRQSTSINVTYDEPDGAAGPWTCHVMMETLPGEMAKAEDDTVVVEFDSDAFSVEYEVDSDSETEAGETKLTENSSDESSSTLGAALLVVCEESDVEYLADYSDSNSGTDAELADADKWECEHCHKKNPPFHRNCGGCWSLRPDWLPTSIKNTQDGACGYQQATLTQLLEPDKSDSLQSQSQEMSKDSLQSRLEQKCHRLQLSNSAAVRDTKVNRKRKCSSSLSTSDSQDGKFSGKMERVQQTNPGISGECKTVDKMKSVSVPTSKDDACVVCLTRRKTASIVHGKTGHQACCYRCATRLKRKRKPCPICRRPIQKVIRNFHV